MGTNCPTAGMQPMRTRSAKKDATQNFVYSVRKDCTNLLMLPDITGHRIALSQPLLSGVNVWTLEHEVEQVDSEDSHHVPIRTGQRLGPDTSPFISFLGGSPPPAYRFT